MIERNNDDGDGVMGGDEVVRFNLVRSRKVER